MTATASDLEGVVLDERVTVTFTELTQLCGSDDEVVRLLVAEGVLHPLGTRPEEWRFSGVEIRRARRALRLQRDLDLNLAGTALALDLLDEVEALRLRIRALEALLDAEG
jgi:chaperone modulatory protein CbpM